jgi:hypothetical protein
MLYMEGVEDWFGIPVSLLATNSPEERDGGREGGREGEREREREATLERGAISKGRVEFQFSLFARKSSCICALFQPLSFVL